MRFAVGRSAVLSHRYETDDESTLTPASVTVTVTREGALSPAFTGTASGTSGVYTVAVGSLPMGVYTVVWNGGVGAVDTTSFEVTGSHMFTVSELRNSDFELSGDRFPADRIIRVRNLVAEEFQTVTGRSFVPRVARASWEVGQPLPRLDVASAAVYSRLGVPLVATLDTTCWPFTFLDVVDDDDPDNYTVELDYGFRILPAGVKNAALLRAKSLLFEDRSGVPDRATSYSPGDGTTYSLATAGRRGQSTGIPDVDAVLDRYTMKLSDSIGGVF